MPKIISNMEQKPIKFISEYVTRRVAYKDTLSENYITTDNILQKYEGIIKYEGTPNTESAISYNEDDILISNIRPYLKKIWFSNQTGCCSTDVLVIRIKAGANCLAKYLFHCLRQDNFFNYSMKKVKGIKMPRGDKEHIMNYKISLPPLEVQEKIVAEFEKIENEISIRKEKLESLKGAYSEILDRYLK
ncbi:MAG: restriction endonuclease subunit S [Campylobacter sp.]|nr:restriction endonuclease subunit S [Campylobacter sp.]